ncbi:MAG: ROK family protein [Halanaerobium sp.]
MKNNISIGVDIGGTKINIAALNKQSQLLDFKTIKTPSQNSEKLLAVLLENIKKFINKFDLVEGIGIATAGRVIFEEKKLAYTTDNLKEWDQSNLYQELKTHFAVPIYLDNDVNAALISELKEINNYQNKNIIFITIGTGLGGALAVNGKIIRGNSGSAGEFGHMILYPNGKQCNCGKKGCAEQYISGKAYQQRLIDKFKKENIALNKKNLSLQKIEREIKSEKGIYYQTLKEMCYDLTLLLESLKNAVDFDLCILGGSFSVYKKQILKLLKQYSTNFQEKYYVKSNYKFAKNRDKAGVIGAAIMVFKENENNKSNFF